MFINSPKLDARLPEEILSANDPRVNPLVDKKEERLIEFERAQHLYDKLIQEFIQAVGLDMANAVIISRLGLRDNKMI